MKEQKLIFVYNAKNDLFSQVTGFAHKIFSPSTYECKLCSFTYGNFSVKDEWKTFVQKLPFTIMVYYKDEFLKHYSMQVDFPAVFISFSDTIKPIISANEIESCKSLDELKSLVISKLKEDVQCHHSNI